MLLTSTFLLSAVWLQDFQTGGDHLPSKIGIYDTASLPLTELSVVDPREFRFEFPCPKCQGRLRLRDRALIGTQWNCPDCQAPLEIRDAGNGGLVATLSSKESQQLRPPTAGIKVRTATALVAVVLITGVAVFVLRAPEPQPPVPVVPPVVAVPQPPVPAPSPAPAAPAPVVSAETQLTAIGQWLTRQHDQHGAFPVGVEPGALPVAERFGWMAHYVEETDNTAQVTPDRTRSWNDPANDLFVRQRAAGLLNPAVAAVASENGYPAGHYVGVAGVGADAALLPKSNPRAGIFGVNRRTTRDDIRDGTSNTLMVLGVDQAPDSWASGAGAVRGLSAEPYLHGPDRFGTGQVDGMHVLMADGSVKFLAAQTDPKLMRRMAAMADGLPLDASVPGEPTDPAPAVVSPVDVPITVEVTPDRTGYDYQRNLSVPLSRFQTPQPVPLRNLLRQLAEMSAMPIDLGDVAADIALDEPVLIDLKQTTIRGVLEECLKPAKLSFTADEKGIRLQRASR